MARSAAPGTGGKKRVRPIRAAAPWWHSRWFTIGGPATVGLATLVGLWAWASLGGTTTATPPTATLPAEVVRAAIMPPSAEVIDAVGKGGISNPFIPAASGTSVRRDSANRPVVLYVGADYCPYCAAERWSIIAALSRFGTFGELTQVTSSSTDVFPDTRTFSFHGSSFTSAYVAFQGVELKDRTQKALDTLDPVQAQVFQKFDQPPYSPRAGGYPFLDIADQYIAGGAGFSPSLIAGKSWGDIASLLHTASQPQTQAIIGTSNYITAAICRATHDQPSAVCGGSANQTIEAALEAGVTAPPQR